MALQKRVKRPAEVLLYDWRFGNQEEFVAGATIASVVETTIEPDDDDDDAAVVEDSVTSSDDVVQAKIQKGVHGRIYVCKATVTTDTGETRQVTGLLIVEDVVLPPQ